MGTSQARFPGVDWVIECHRVRPRPRTLGGPVEDLAYIGLTILVFGVLWLLVKGVERFER